MQLNWRANYNAKRILRKLDPHWPQSAAAQQALAQIVEKCLCDDDRQREAAIEAVGMINPEWWKSDDAQSLVPTLLQHLTGHSYGVEKDATKLLIRIGPSARTAAVESLLERLVAQAQFCPVAQCDSEIPANPWV